jgi:chromate reductase, NAD(P)H dehydrogenase (quinone)
LTARLLLVSGSLRARSTNTAVLRTAAAVAPADMECDLYPGLGLLPHFNPDDEEGPLDPAVGDLRGRIHGADALVFSTPEYAGALPGSFKNLLDWTIGDDQPGSIYEKPVGWVNASHRGAGGAHRELRTVLAYAHARLIDSACAQITITSQMVGPDGVIADGASRIALAGVVAALSTAAASVADGPQPHSR